MTLAFDIKKARETAGLSQTSLGELLGVATGSTAQVLVCGWETGRRPIEIPDSALPAFANLLNVTDRQARLALRKYRNAYKAKIRARKSRASKAKASATSRPSPARDSLVKLVDNFKPASTSTADLLAWYNAVRAIDEVLP